MEKKMLVRKWVDFREEINSEGGRVSEIPLKKVAVAAVIKNPYAGRWSDDLSELLEPSGELARELIARCKSLLGGEVESCGKGALIGARGEQEHGVACLTTTFGDAMRSAIGGETWVTSTTKMASAGMTIDIPLAYKRALYVREFYDTVTVSVPDAPWPDEIVVVAAMANRGRLNHRIGGLRKEDVVGGGLR